MGATVSEFVGDTPRVRGHQTPAWICTPLYIHPERQADRWGPVSEGMAAIAPHTVRRTRTGAFHTDGARWSKGFNSGKHVWEVIFPVYHRGLRATVGVGTDEAPLFAQGKKQLCGDNPRSWGICLRVRKAFHRGKAGIRWYPQDKRMLPDRILMYLDLDQGTLAFGSDGVYHGPAHTGLPCGKELLYPMACPTQSGADITMVYLGEGSQQATQYTTQVPMPLPYGQTTTYVPQGAPVAYPGAAVPAVPVMPGATVTVYTSTSHPAVQPVQGGAYGPPGAMPLPPPPGYATPWGDKPPAPAMPGAPPPGMPPPPDYSAVDPVYPTSPPPEKPFQPSS